MNTDYIIWNTTFFKESFVKTAINFLVTFKKCANTASINSYYESDGVIYLLKNTKYVF